MKKITEYGFISSKKDEKLIIERLNEFLAPLKRTFAKNKSDSYLKGYLPYVYKYVYFNLNKDVGTFMELIPNEDIKDNYKYPDNKNVAWIFRVFDFIRVWKHRGLNFKRSCYK